MLFPPLKDDLFDITVVTQRNEIKDYGRNEDSTGLRRTETSIITFQHLDRWGRGTRNENEVAVWEFLEGRYQMIIMLFQVCFSLCRLAILQSRYCHLTYLQFGFPEYFRFEISNTGIIASVMISLLVFV